MERDAGKQVEKEGEGKGKRMSGRSEKEGGGQRARATWESGAKAGQEQTAVHRDRMEGQRRGAPGLPQAPATSQTPGAPPLLGSLGPGVGPPGLSPTTWSTRAWLSSPMGCKETVGIMGEVVPGGPPESPSAQHGAHHVRVGPVGQPQRPQVEVLLELGLLGVQDYELLADLPAMCPQALILGVLGVGQVGSAQEGAGVPRPV